MSRTADIIFNVHLDEKKIPNKIEWTAEDSGFTKKECKSMMISLWDKEEKVTMGIDLWTEDMLVDDMNIHFHQTFLKLADTYERATNNNEAASMIKSFAADFAEMTGLTKKT